MHNDKQYVVIADNVGRKKREVREFEMDRSISNYQLSREVSYLN